MPQKHIALLERIVNACDIIEHDIKCLNYGAALQKARFFRMAAIEHLDKEGYEQNGDIFQKKRR